MATFPGIKGSADSPEKNAQFVSLKIINMNRVKAPTTQNCKGIQQANRTEFQSQISHFLVM